MLEDVSRAEAGPRSGDEDRLDATDGCCASTMVYRPADRRDLGTWSISPYFGKIAETLVTDERTGDPLARRALGRSVREIP